MVPRGLERDFVMDMASSTRPLDWLDDFLYLPETLYIVILIWLICSGPGKVSVDDRIARAIGYLRDKNYDIG